LAAQAPRSLPAEPTITSAVSSRRRSERSGTSARSDTSPPTTKPVAIEPAWATMPSPVWPPTPPRLPAIESIDSMVARSSEGITSLRYACFTGVITPIVPVATSRSGIAAQKEPAKPTPTAATP
jgi:hypothetical protein